MLKTTRWIRCTRADALEWRASGYNDVYNDATDRKIRPASEVAATQSEPGAFYRHLETIANTERALGAVGREAAQEEGLMAGTY